MLDLAHPRFAERIDTNHPGSFEFIRLTVAHVENPERIGLYFQVAFVPDNGNRIPLSGFSLYPQDNPGLFLVSTRHLVDSSGFVEVLLRTATPVKPGTRLSITMGPIGLAKGLQ